jgi:hypothetical protein
MTVVYILLTLIGVIALAALAAHFLPKSSNTKIAALEADLNWLYDKVFPASATTLNVPAVAFPTAPPGAIPAVPMSPPAVETMNGIPVPSGLTLASFTALVVATSGAASMLSNTDLHGALVGSSQAWWDGLGAFFREELMAQATGPVLTAFKALAAASTVPVRLITAEQQAAAQQAANVVAPKPA